MKKIIALLGVFLMGVTLAWAAGPVAGETPQQTVQAASDVLLHELKAKKIQIDKDPPKVLYSIVKESVLPYIDINGMVSDTLGREGNQQWIKAPAAEKTEFIDEMTKLIVGTYSGALTQYDDQAVKIYPVRGYKPDMTAAQVNSELITKQGQAIGISYQMVKQGDVWKVRDFSVEGVSLVNSYQAQFQSIIADKNLEGLIQTLKEHNAANQPT